MDNQTQPNPLPEKVLRRHIVLLQELLPDFERLVFDEGRPADVLLNQHLRTHKELGSRDRRFLSQATFSYFRWHGWTVGKLALPPAEAALIGTLLDGAELHPSFQHMLKNGTLPAEVQPLGTHSLTEKCNALNTWFNASLKPADLIPSGFDKEIGTDVFERCIEQLQQRPEVWLRSRISPESFIQSLKEQNLEGTSAPHLPAAIRVSSGTNLNHALSKKEGTFSVQDISSQCVGYACAPRPGEEWWDCCAGAGGKSLHLIDLMQQNGSVLATDVRLSALKELKKRARRYGIRQIRTQTFNAASDEPFPKAFDGILVDAPCSGWGTWGRNPDARWRTSIKEVAQCATRQLKILNTAAWCVKPGAPLIYAVCTMTHSETEEVVAKFLEQQPRFRLDPFKNPISGELTDGTLQVWPWDGPGDAMYMARFIKDQ